MSDSLIAVTYRYACVLNEKKPHPGGEMENTGKKIDADIERTIVVPKMLADQMIEIDMQSQRKHSPGFRVIGNVEKRPVSLTYPAPYYWSK